MVTVPVTDLTWTFDPDRSDGGILVDSADEDMPEYRVGKTYQMDLIFWRNTQDTDSRDNLDRYEAVREYSRWAGRYAMERTIDGTARFSEHIPDDASVDSIVVQFIPDSGLTATDGLWIILDDVDDSTRYAEDLARIGLRFTVLARADQYGSRDAIKNDLGSDLV
jgi:hypothetical protein